MGKHTTAAICYSNVWTISNVLRFSQQCS